MPDASAAVAGSDLGPGVATDFAREFADFSAGLRATDLPAAVADAVRANLLDTLTCAIGGANAPGVGALRDLVAEWGGAAQAPIWCGGPRVPAHHAAWVNGMMAHARDYDDTHDAAVLHAGVSVVPAALAAAELRPEASGADLLAGIAVGLELVCRLGVATRIGIIDSGFIYTSLFGYFGATAAAARVLGFDARRTQNALGIAYSQTAGTHQVTRDAALTKRMQPGFAAKAALVAVQLAQREIRGAQLVFEGEDGLFRTYLRGEYDPVVLRDGIGERFELLALSYKPYPCCRFNHTAIDAAFAVRARPGFDIARVDRIDVGLNHQAYEAVCTPPAIRRRPETVVQAQFSIPYAVACALLDGEVGLRHFSEAALQRSDVLDLAKRVECRVDPAIERDFGRAISPATLLVEVGDTVLQARIDLPSGHPDRKMTAAASEAKLADCIAFSGLAWPEDAPARLRDMVRGLEALRESRSLNAALKPVYAAPRASSLPDLARRP
jgi:2-methylcitrate dehydratase PrpD